jgi:antitoxin CptB
MTELLLDVSRIKWRCRRGMLELDLFLIPFCENVYPSLEAEEKRNFIDLLEENDVDLFQWLMAHGECKESRFDLLIKLIRAYRLGG